MLFMLNVGFLFTSHAQSSPPSPPLSVSDPDLTDPLNKDDVKISYLLTDHLGSIRVITSEQGAELARFDYYPYGEEIELTQQTTNSNQLRLLSLKL